ncbi:hypothetical protein OROGR_001487 [Orobanche gracilis]
MKLSQGPPMRRQLSTVCSAFQTIYSSCFLPVHFPYTNSDALTYSLCHRSFSDGRSLSFSAAATPPSPLSPISSAGGKENGGIPLRGSKVLLKGMRYHELEKWVQSLNKDFKRMLDEHAEYKALHFKDMMSASDGTKKRLQILFMLEDGQVIETVVIPCPRGRTTVCVSSQVGCAMNCQFCYTGSWYQISGTSSYGDEDTQISHVFDPIFHNSVDNIDEMGLKRNLSAAEIVEQAVFARRLLSHEVGSITNVVFMGMGEPLHNIENVIKAADILVDDQGLHFSPRKVSISTSGLVPQIKRFLKESNCALAVSLNATTDEVRNWIMPINRKYNLELLLGTLREELCLKHNYKVLFEYVMLAGVNDSSEDAKRLISLVQGIPCKINLISFNPHSGSRFKPTREDKMIEFRNILAEAGCVVFLRSSRGDDQMAACGQLGKPGDIQAPLLKVPPKFRVALEAPV